MASPFSGRSGRTASVAVMDQLAKSQHDITDLIDQNTSKSIRSLKDGYTKGRDAYGRASDLYDPYAQTGLSAFNQYADASGVNGQAGYDRAEGSFRASPGYQYQVDQALDQTARKASATGSLASGNTLTALQDRASHLADQEYDGYLGRLDNIGKTGFAATGAQAGLEKGIGDLGVTYGQNKADTYQGYTGMGVQSRQNTQMAIADALKGGMLAGQNAAANRWNFGMQGVKLLADFAGSATGGKLLGLA